MTINASVILILTVISIIHVCRCEQTCGGRFTTTRNASGTLILPPGLDPVHHCVWVLVRDGNASVSYTTITLQDIVLGNGDSLMVYNGAVGRGTGQPVLVLEGPFQKDFQLVVTTDNETTIIYNDGGKILITDTIKKPPPFSKCYYSMTGCTTNMDVNPNRRSVVISSPIYTHPVVDHNITCTYSITTPNNNKMKSRISLSFLNVSLPVGSQGNLLVYDGSVGNGIVLASATTGAQPIPKDLIATGYAMPIKLRFSLKMPGTKFTALLEAVSRECSEAVAATHPVTLQPPAAGGDNVGDMKCRWVLEADSRDTLVAFKNQQHPGLVGRSGEVLVVDGGTGRGRELAEFSSISDNNRLVLTTSNLMWVTVNSWSQRSTSNFSLSVLPQRQGRYIRGSSGTITYTPGLEPGGRGDKVYYQLEEADGKQMSVSIDSSTSTHMTDADYVLMYEGASVSESHLLANYSKDSKIQSVSTTSSNIITIILKGFRQEFTG